MARLPGAEALGERPLPALPRRTPMVAGYRPTTGFEESVSRELGKSGAELEQAARIELQAKEQQDTLRAEDAVNRLRQRQIDMTYGKGGFMELKGGDAVNKPLLKDYGSAFDQAAAQLSDGLGNEYQKQLFQRRAQIAGLQLREHIVQHVAHQSEVYAETVYKSKLDIEGKAAAAQWSTPDGAAVSLLNIDNAIDERARRLGLRGNEGQAWVDDQRSKARSIVYSNMVKQALFSDPNKGPVIADNIFKRFSAEIDPGQRAVLQHEINVAKIPIEAREGAERVVKRTLGRVQTELQLGGQATADQANVADTATSGNTLAALKAAIRDVGERSGPNDVSVQGARGRMQITEDTFNAYKKSGESFDNEADRVRVAERKIESDYAFYGGDVRKTAAAYIGGRGAIDQQGNIKDVKDALGTTATAYADRIAARVGQPPRTKIDVQAQLGQAVADAEGEAERIRPGDIMFRDQMVHNVRAYFGTLLAAYEGQQKAAVGRLLSIVHPMQGPKPTTTDALLSSPQARADFYSLDIAQQNGFLAKLEHNLRESLGRPIPVDGKVVMDILNRIYAPSSDPQKITSVPQLVQFFGPGKGINTEAFNFLSAQIDKAQSTTGGKFSHDVQAVGNVARSMLVRSMVGAAQPEVAELAAYTFRRDLDAKVDEYQKAGKDPRTLFTPGTPDFVLTPAKVMSYLNITPQQAVAGAAQAGGQHVIGTIGGGPANAVTAPTAPGTSANPVTVRSDKDFNDLAKGTYYRGPDGKLRQK